MYWHEEEDKDAEFVVPDDVVDVAFGLRCRALPVEHAFALSEAVRRVLPWFGADDETGLHLIHGADSGNGWERPEAPDALIYPSRRARLTLRLSRHRVEDARALTGQTLSVLGHDVGVGEGKIRLLSTETTLYARYVACDPALDEEGFLGWVVTRLQHMGCRFKKVLPGKGHELDTPDGPLNTRSLMVADLPVQDTVRLQQSGLGGHRRLGCGLFIPHKSIKAM